MNRGRTFGCAVALGAVLSGCAGHYRYTSDAGRQCFYMCRSIDAQCYAGMPGIGGALICADEQKRCLATCPDLVYER